MELIDIVFVLGVLIFSVVLHEVSHGVTALAQGDTTARDAGRLTLNPIPHLDPIGSLLVPGLLSLAGGPVIGWAKPVPVNPAFFKDRKYGNLKVSFAGPAANLALFLVFGLILRLLWEFGLLLPVLPLLSTIVFINLLLAVFNLIPIPPLDGSHVLFTFLSDRYVRFKEMMATWGFFILLLLIFVFRGIFFGILFLPIAFLFQLVVGTSFLSLPSLLW